jgi:hypothetical protein
MDSKRKESSRWNLWQRRLDCLKADQAGVSTTVWVAQLALKYGVSEVAIWKDWGKRKKWMPEYVTYLDEAEELYRWFQNELGLLLRELKELMTTAGQDTARVSAANSIKDIIFKRLELAQSMGMLERVPDQAEVTIRQEQITETVQQIANAFEEGGTPEELEMVVRVLGKLKKADESL